MENVFPYKLYKVGKPTISKLIFKPISETSNPLLSMSENIPSLSTRKQTDQKNHQLKKACYQTTLQLVEITKQTKKTTGLLAMILKENTGILITGEVSVCVCVCVCVQVCLLMCV